MLDKKKLIILLVAAILFIGLIFGFLFWFNKKNSSLLDVVDNQINQQKVISKPHFPKLNGAAYTSILKSDCSKAEDKTRCDDSKKSEEAYIENNSNKCSEINTLELKDDCYKKMAIYTQKVENCDKIDNYDKKDGCRQWMAVLNNDEKVCDQEKDDYRKQECKDRLHAYQISATNDPERCKNEIKTLEYPNLCFKRIMMNFGNDCSKFKNIDDQKKCASIGTFEMAQEVENWKLCDNIPLDNYRKVCKNLSQGITDSDNDGWSDSDELFFGIDPFNPDTDGDGYSDFDEMEKYHTNPKDPNSR